MSGRRSRRSSGDRGGGANSKSLSWSSDDTWSGSARKDRSKRQGRQPRSPSLNSGSSIDSPTDTRGQRLRSAMRRDSSSPAELFTQSEDRAISKSLRRKLLSNNGARLGRVERRLFRADRLGDGLIPVVALKDALAEDGKAERGGGRILPDEVVWLSEKLKGRNGKRVDVFKIRKLLESGTENGRSGTRRDDRTHQSRRHQVHKYSGRLKRREGHGPGSAGGGWARAGGDETSGSDSCRSKDASQAGDSARWATQQGTVGQWLNDVASPMERKLFFDFVRGLENFEHRNGLDHYRVQPAGGHVPNGVGGRDNGTTVVHLGPMLKAAVRFYI